MKDGFVKAAVVTPRVRVADCGYNAARIEGAAGEAAEKGAALCVFPELCLTAATCGDLFLQDTLLRGAEDALNRIIAATARYMTLFVVGLPVRVGGALYNAAAVFCRGKLLGVVPKSALSNEGECGEARYFASGRDLKPVTLHFAGQETVFGAGLRFRCRNLPGLVLGCELGGDLMDVCPPSAGLAVRGATVIACPFAGAEAVARDDFRRETVKNLSARLLCGYLLAGAGAGESTQDLVYPGHSLIAENGEILAESERFTNGTMTVSELDVDRLQYERRRRTGFAAAPDEAGVIEFDLPLRDTLLTRKIEKMPFVPEDRELLEKRCEEIIRMQAVGLAARLKHTRCKNVVIGLSGGLDSTLALIVTVHAFDLRGLDRSGIHAVTMPCFGTTSRTKSNAMKLAECYGASLQTVDIKDAVRQHFEDIGHSYEEQNVTFENAQARMRTLVLMDLANQVGGLVIGTGDLSELALGWATYNGDHMSMYGVNGDVPKTLVRYLTAYEAAHSEDRLKNILLDVLGTPVSPELLPPKDGQISQCTEELVGPYELHDFFLYYLLRFGYSPRKVYRLALHAWGETYDPATVKKWLVTFVRRFFMQQFKRSCLPDGPKVGSVGVSPRGDLRLPSDAVSELWLTEAEGL